MQVICYQYFNAGFIRKTRLKFGEAFEERNDGNNPAICAVVSFHVDWVGFIILGGFC
jgi:hypothetical protein